MGVGHEKPDVCRLSIGQIVPAVGNAFDEAESQPRRHDPERVPGTIISRLGSGGYQIGEHRVSYASAQDDPDADFDPDPDADFDPDPDADFDPDPDADFDPDPDPDPDFDLEK